MFPFSVLLLAALILHLAGCGDPPVTLPGSLAGLQRSRLLEGEEAKAVVDKLHGRGVTPRRNLVAEYAGARGTATLYYSQYGAADEAESAGRKMAEKIREGNSPFTAPVEIDRGGKKIYLCGGLGQQHYFFPAGDGLYWLAVDPEISSAALSELLVPLMLEDPI